MMAVGLLLAACNKPPIETGPSNRATGYSTKLQRVLVAVSLHAEGMTNTHKNFLMSVDELKQAFDNKLAKPLGITVECVDLDHAADKAQALSAAVATTRPTHVIQLKTANYRTISYVLESLTLDVSIVDMTLKKPVWRTLYFFTDAIASGRNRNGFFGTRISHQDDADDLVSALATKLKADGLL